MAKLTVATLNTRVDAIESKLDKVLELLANAQTPAPAPAKAKAKATKKGKGKAPINEVDKKAKAEENAKARLAYKQDKRTRNCLTKAENKALAAQMRAKGLEPKGEAWEKAKKAYIKANPLV